MKICLWFMFGLYLWLTVVWPKPALSQDGPAVRVIHVDGTPQQEHFSLNVFFTLVDLNGRPFADVDLESATIQLLNEQGAALTPAQANIFDPQTPIYVAMLLDTSGSMVQAMPAVREAAKAAIDQAPPHAFFAVVPFNAVPLDQPLRPLSGFTNDRSLVKSDIDLVNAQNGGPTCLYNAAYQAIELLEQQVKAPQERRAIILFTDGRDEVQNGQPCSQRTLENVIARATNDRSKLTPIFTIGLAEGENVRVEPAVLQRLARETNAYFAIGDRNGVGNLFQEIMGYLNSQLLVQANVLPHEGVNQALLQVKVREGALPLTEAFFFLSPIGYEATAAVIPVGLRIGGISQYDSTNNNYILTLSVDNPEGIGSIRIKVKDKEANTDLYELSRPPEPSLAVTIDARPFKPGREYVVEATALDENEHLIMTQPAPNSSDEPKPVQVQTPLKHAAPEPPKPVTMAVQGVKADFNTQQLVIDLNISERERVDKYAGFIRDENGQIFGRFGPAVFLLPAPGQPLQLREALPLEIRNAHTLKEYSIVVQVWTKKDELQTDSEPFPFKVEPPPQPGAMSKVLDALYDPYVQIPIVVILLSVAGWLWLRTFTRRKEEPPPALPIDYTEVAVTGVALDAQARVRVKLTRAPNQTRELNELVTLPCVIGRHEVCTINLANYTTDMRISRRHIEIKVDKGAFFVSDLGSDNGTFINGSRLPAHKPKQLANPTTVRLGPETSIEIQAES